MPSEILTYDQMCQRENKQLVKGINFDMGTRYSIVLMSRAPDAQYHDEFQENNTVLIYEGHDVPDRDGINPKMVNQPERTPSGSLTQNGKFHEAAQQFNEGLRTAERVKVYEKLQEGVWLYHGMFLLTDSWVQSDGVRNVFKFKLTATNEDQFGIKTIADIQRRKIIPSPIMINILKQRGRKCQECGNKEQLSFVHTTDTITPENVRIVCNNHKNSVN